MNIEALKQIVNSDLPPSVKEVEIIKVLAADKNSIPEIMKVLAEERRVKTELISDMNLQLSKAHIYIDERPEIKTEAKQNFNKGFVLDEISKFYIKYKSLVTHCFNRFK